MAPDFLLPPAPFPRRIYLTGFMGSGKSAVAVSLADRLGFTSIDLDKLVEALTGRSVAALFSEGEAVFRAAERETLARTFDKPQIVVATGGGALLDPAAMEAAQSVGCVVYLRLPADSLVARLDADPKPRPLLQGPGGTRLRGEVLRSRVEELLATRVPRYERANVVLDVEGLTPREIGRAAAHGIAALSA